MIIKFRDQRIKKLEEAYINLGEGCAKCTLVGDENVALKKKCE